MRTDLDLGPEDIIYITTKHGGTWKVTPYAFGYGYGVRIEPIGSSYVPVCKALAERPDLVEHQKKTVE